MLVKSRTVLKSTSSVVCFETVVYMIIPYGDTPESRWDKTEISCSGQAQCKCEMKVKAERY